MNDEEIQLQLRLREATGSGAKQSVASDPETAALAESWQMLGQLLDADNADFRPEPIIRQLRRRLLQQRMWRGAGLLAAALLIGVGITWYVNRGGTVGPGVLGNGANSVVVSPPKTPAQGSVDPTSTVVADSNGAESAKGGWDQSLDEQIAQANETVRSAPLLAANGDERIEQLDQQLTSFSQEIEANSL